MKTIRIIGIAFVWALAATMHAQTYKVLAYLTGTPSTPVEPGLIAQSPGGNLMTTASDQGTDLRGVAFRVTTEGAVTVLHEFSQPEGILPASGLTLARDGRFYGTTVFGGASNTGAVFQMTPDGIVKTLHQFGGAPDGNPYAPPVQSLYGDFYGTTHGNDSDPNASPGTIYKIDTAGNYTLLHTFTVEDGANPLGALVQGVNYWFYGTAMHGGPSSVGTIFRVSTSGKFQVLYNFDYSHGGYPMAMIQANDGNFYGVTYLGGASNQGVVFKLTGPNQLTVLHEFTGGNDGGGPLGGFLQGSDGFLYGTTGSGGSMGGGTLFRMSPTTGGIEVLHSFHAASGVAPVALMQHTNGFFYGATNADGVSNGMNALGVIFRLDMGLSPFVTFLNTYGRVGMTVSLLGDGFTTSSQVFFNGVAATEISGVGPSFMKVVIPEGATTGPITVTTTKGTLTSNKVFVVRP